MYVKVNLLLTPIASDFKWQKCKCDETDNEHKIKLLTNFFATS